jgi:uncharacterized membrane protein
VTAFLESIFETSHTRPLRAAPQPEPVVMPQVQAIESVLERPARPRLDSIDLLRGLVMVIMVLDHTRDFFGASGMNPRDVNEPLLFLTRWVTHFCAPTFVFLAGVSAFLYGSRPGRTAGDVSRFLLTRGLWMVLLELTVVNFGWSFDARFEFVALQVIWAIGWSMIALSLLVHLPRVFVAALAVGVIVGHNLLDAFDASHFGALGWLWNILHQPAELQPSADRTILALYPLIPWVGVMAAGYAIGPVMLREPARRRETLMVLGTVAVAAFVLVRATNGYGDPGRWSANADSVLGPALSFVNCEKYPPSMLFLAMTLGPALLALAAFNRAGDGPLARVLVTFGRAPLLFYVAHLYLLHLLAIGVSLAMTGEAAWLFSATALMNKPAGFGFGLGVVYALWLSVVTMLYPLSKWFAGIKQRRKEWWLSYL